jgi:hypothetical protein
MFFSSSAFVTNLWIVWGTSFFLLCPLWKKKLFVMLCGKKNDFPQCYVRCFCVYYKRCKISPSMWVHPYFFVTCLCLHINGSMCGFDGWWMLFDVIITNPTCTYLVLHATLSHGCIMTITT